MPSNAIEADWNHIGTYSIFEDKIIEPKEDIYDSKLIRLAPIKSNIVKLELILIEKKMGIDL